jgi:hypothetical protein
MSEIFAMQRANGDVFALDNDGGFRIPVFQTAADAHTARMRNVEMLLFKPAVVGGPLLKELLKIGEARDVEFWLVSDPLIDLKHGVSLRRPEFAAMLAKAA